MILKAGHKFPGPLGDVSQIAPGDSEKKKVRRRQECIIKDMATALVICNNVTPVEDNGGKINTFIQREYYRLQVLTKLL
jgi:hypothetical protein